ncbi:MAG: hypothetical protein DI551_00150 [Micavibrio aeruginosavorus]|uniref:C-type lectin domain-containing protein n=1 Tax=Micavibrio aeruginosavorus TaxID=349221 RepID=A0A2W5N9Z0_9BACT|nr:MAG: hypothetical protein DI551_00150 [Micavibrio aeruginosavorus]
MIMPRPYILMRRRSGSQSGNIFFMLFASIALIGVFTVGAGNVVKGVVTSMSDVTRKSVAEERMNSGGRISIQQSAGCDVDTLGPNNDQDMMEPLPFKTATGPHPDGGGWFPDDIGVTEKDPWGTPYGYCAWNPGNGTCGAGVNLLTGSDQPTDVVIAVISAGKDRQFSTKCNPQGGGVTTPADCTGLGDNHYNDPVTGKCFFVTSNTTNFSGANASCVSAGGDHLATLTTAAEQVAITNLTTVNWTWIAGTDDPSEGVWRWTQGPESGTQFWQGDQNGSAFGGNYASWQSGEPNGGTGENCAGTHPSGYGSGNWIDENCNSNLRAVCEKNATVSLPSGPPVDRAAGSDDLIMEYTYNEANGLSGNDLWRIKDVSKDTATIEKEIDVTGGATLAGPLALENAGLILPGNIDVDACDATTDQQLRINYDVSPPVLVICDFSGGGSDWEAVSMGGSVSNYVPPEGIISRWKLNETTGTAAEDSIGDHDGSWQGGGSVVSVSGHEGTAYDLNGTNYVSVPDDNDLDLTRFTLSAWIKPHGLPNNGVERIVGKGIAYNTANYAMFWSHFTPVACEYRSDSGFIATPSAGSAFPADTWYLLTCTYDGNDLKMYIDGELVQTTSSQMTPLVNSQAVGLGALGNGDEKFDGIIDDVMIFSRGLSAEEVMDIYNDENTALAYESGLCAGASAIGDHCNNGNVYMGEYGGYYYYTTPCDFGQTWNGTSCTGSRGTRPWNFGNTSGAVYVGGTTNDDGTTNTTTLEGTDSDSVTTGFQPHRAAQVCGDLNSGGYEDWFLPSINEMSTIFYPNRVAIGGFETSGSFYTSSTEAGSSGAPLNIARLKMQDGTTSTTGDQKPVAQYIRCMRRFSTNATTGPGGLIHRWKLDETTGTSVEDSISGNDGSWEGGGSVVSAPGQDGTALNLNATNYIQVLKDVTMEATRYTISMWVNGDTAPVTSTTTKLYDRSDDKTFNWSHDWGSPLGCEQKEASSGNWFGTGPSGVTVTPGQWYFVACTYDGTRLRTYVDGIERSSVAVGPPATGLPYNFTFGSAVSGSLKFDGKMDDIRFFNRALSADEMVALYEGTYGQTIEEDVASDTQGVHQEMNVCKAAGSGPFTKVGQSDNGFYYRTPLMTEDYLYVGGYNNGLSAFARGAGTLTRLDNEQDVDGNTINGQYFDGATIFVAQGSDDLLAYSFDGTSFTKTGQIAPGSAALDVTGDGRYVYVAESGFVRAYSFSGGTFTLAGSFDNAGTASNIWSDGTYIYVSAGNGGFYVLTFSGSAFTQVAQITPAGGDTRASWGDGHYIYIATNNLLAYSFDGTALTLAGTYNSGQTLSWGFGDGVNIFAGYGSTQIQALRFDGSNFKVISSYPIEDQVRAFRTDGSYLYVTYQNDPIDIFTGFACDTPTALSAATVLAADKYRGRISTGEASSCGVKPDGTAWCWGAADNGQLGNGSAAGNKTSPSRVNGTAGYVQITTGDDFSCGLQSNGAISCWGSDTGGRLGNGAVLTADQTSPSSLSGTGPWIQVSAGTEHACGIKADGTAWCWGVDTNGRLGNGAGSATQEAPSAVDSTSTWTQISAGYDGSCGIKSDGSAWCWGRNNYGQLGNSTTGTDEVSPFKVSDAGPWVQISRGYESVCGVKLDGSLWCWGRNELGQLGNGAINTTLYSIPAPVSNAGPWLDVSVSLTDGTVCGVQTNGTAWCWGEDDKGQLGNGDTLTSSMPVPSRVLDPGPWATIVAGKEKACGLKTDGSAWCWGTDANGELGNGTAIVTDPMHIPSRVENFPNISPWQWTDNGTTLSAAGASNISMGTSAGISYDATAISSLGNGLSFPSAGNSVLRQNPGSSELLLQAAGTNASAQLSWKTVTASATRSAGIDYTTSFFELGVNNAGVSNYMNAITPQVEISTTGGVGVGTSGTIPNKLTINGGLKIGADNSLLCTVLRTGAIRYVGGATPYQYCNGSAWVTL